MASRAYLRRAVRGAVALMEDGAGTDSITAYHLAVGIMVQPPGKESATVPKLVQDGIVALHETAHAMADDGVILLEDYANEKLVAALVMCEARILLLPGGPRG